MEGGGGRKNKRNHRGESLIQNGLIFIFFSLIFCVIIQIICETSIYGGLGRGGGTIRKIYSQIVKEYYEYF